MDQQLENPFPPGFEESLGFHSLGSSERTFSSSSTSSGTSFISEGSFSNILRSVQDSGFRDVLGYPTTSTPYRLNNGFGSLRRENETSVYSQIDSTNSTSIDEAFFPNSSLMEHSRDSGSDKWELNNSLELCGTLPRALGGGDSHSQTGSKFLGSHFSGLKQQMSPPCGTSKLPETDFIYQDAVNRSLESNMRALDISSNGIWNSSFPTAHQQPSQSQGAGLNALPARLSAKECVNVMQHLSRILDECKETGDQDRAAQTVALMQLAPRISDIQTPPPSPTPTTPVKSTSSVECSVDATAKQHRKVAGIAEARHTWSGRLPPRFYHNPSFSPKIFLGGMPFDISEYALIQAFKPYGNVKIQWPQEDLSSKRKGYVYVLFESEAQVKHLLQNCYLDYSQSKAGEWYYKLSSRRHREKDVQVIPWGQEDSNFSKCNYTKIDGKKTIFVGALHGQLNAEALATIMDDLFGGVVYAGIDTDKNRYPIGSGRVTFNNTKSYLKAISAGFVEIKSKFEKTIQLDPYLEDATCSVCDLQLGPYFCRDFSCFRYFCRTCFEVKHEKEDLSVHRPIMRNAAKPIGNFGPSNAHTPKFSPVRPRNRGSNNSNGHFTRDGSSSNSNWNSSFGHIQRRNDFSNCYSQSSRMNAIRQ